MKKYKFVVCGGTFDVLHKGHKDFLDKILKISGKVFLGLTSDQYVNKYKPNRGIAPFDKRKKDLINFLKELKAQDRVEIRSIDDMYGPLLDPSFKAEALAVTLDSYSPALKINSKRKEKSLLPLKVIKIPLTKDNKGKILSSTRLKKGYVDKGGRLILPSPLRRELQKPFGELFEDVPEGLDDSKVITVGDVTSQKFFSKNLKPKLSIIDFLVARKPIKHKSFKDMKVIEASNPAGTISFELFETIKNSFKDSSRKILVVKGEEDLSVLPVLMTAPNGHVIFYGQPGEGLVKILVNHENKKKARKLLDRFTLESK